MSRQDSGKHQPAFAQGQPGQGDLQDSNPRAIRLAAQLRAFLLQDSLDLIQFNDAEKNPVVGIINIHK